MGAEETLAGLPEPGQPIFYPKVGHCIFRGVTEDRVAPGTRLVELEDIEEGSRILIPLERVSELHLRAAGTALDVVQEELSAEFEEPLADEQDRQRVIEELITEGSPRNLARALKRLHFLRQTTGLSREEEQTRKKIRSWLAAEVSIARECTRAEAQAFMTRVLQDAMAEHRRKEKEEAKERRRAAKEQKKSAAEVEPESQEVESVAGGVWPAEPAELKAMGAPESEAEDEEGNEIEETSSSS